MAFIHQWKDTRIIRPVILIAMVFLAVWPLPAAAQPIRVFGAVRDKQTREAIQDAYVTIRQTACEFSDCHTLSTKTDERGRFEFNYTGGRKGMVVFHSAEVEPRVLEMKGFFAEPEQKEVELDFEHPGYASLSGVVQYHGRPVPGCPVKVHPDWAVIDTDNEGRFSFNRVPAGQVKLVYSKNAYPHTVAIPAGEKGHVELELPNTLIRSIKGRVSADGKPVAGGLILFHRIKQDRTAWPARSAAISEDGTFQMDWVMPGEYLINILPHKAGVSPTDASVEVGTSLGQLERQKYDYQRAFFVQRTIKESDAALELAPGSSSLTVKLAQWTDLSNPVGIAALVPAAMRPAWPNEFTGKMAAVNPDNSVTFDQVEPGSYDVMLHSCSRESMDHCRLDCLGKVKVGTEPEEITWTLPESARISGRVRIKHEQDAGDVEILIISTDNPNLRNWSGALNPVRVTKPNGTFGPVRVPHGQVLISACKAGYSCDIVKMSLDDDAVFNPELIPAGSVTVQLEGPDDQIVGQRIQVIDAKGELVRRLHSAAWLHDRAVQMAVVPPTDGQGVTRVAGLRPGTYTIQVKGTSVKAKFDIAAMDQKHIKLVIGNANPATP